MKRLIREMRLLMVSVLIGWISVILPKDATEYWIWLSKMPIND